MNRLRIISCLAMVFVLSACQTIVPDGPYGESALKVSLDGISAEVALSKAAPGELIKPLASEFNINVVRNSNGAVVFDRIMGEESVLVKVVPDEQYTVTATYGQNQLLAINEPFYSGTAVASVTAGETKNVGVECSVCNSLISARFGSDQAGQMRFSKYFSECSLDIHAGDFFVSLPMNADGISAYLRTGTEYSAIFNGTMKETGEKRSFVLAADMMPSTLNAAEHLIITLDLKIETGVDITISKAEVVDVNISHTIPFSWLPMPDFTYQHKFNSDGILLGTDLSCSASYPGCKWTAQVRNSAGTLVRTLTGKGALSSAYSSSSEWPYLPSGTYTATFSYEYDGQTIDISGKTKTFTVSSPSGLIAKASGVTSYDRYKSGDISGANQCNAFTLYDTAVYPGLSNEIRANGNYKNLISATGGSVWIDTDTGRKNFTGASTGSFGSLATGNHTFNASLTFDGAQATTSFPFIITGLPVTFNPPTEAAGWYKTDGTISWESNSVKLGQWAWSNPHAIKYDKIHVPMGTKVSLSYNAKAMTGTVETTFKLVFGSNEILNSKTNGKDIEFKGSYTFITGSDAKTIEVSSSWGSGKTGAVVYSLSFAYAQ